MIVAFLGLNNVFASSVSVKTSATSITRGNTVTITTTVNADSGIYTIEGSMSCSGAGVNGGIDLTYEDMNTSAKSKSFTYTIKPTSSGTVTCTTSNVKIRELAKESNYQLSNSSVTIKVNDPVVIPPKVYSSDNNLSSLSVKGYTLSPGFNKNTLEYKLEVDESVEEIEINAKPNDSKATISGIGKKTLTPGENTIVIKVKAENGNEKSYKIIVTVKDQHPITVSIDKDKYTIVKKNNNVIDKLKYYDEEIIKIDGQDVVSYKNDKSGIVLVVLKNAKNEVGYYMYDAVSGDYKVYNEYKIGNITLNLLPVNEEDLPIGYEKYSLTLANDKVEAYKLSKNSSFGLFYAMNIETGEKSLYLYDEEEGTVQRYDIEISKYFSASIVEEADNYKKYFYIAVSAFCALAIVFICVLVMNKKGKIRKNKVKI